VHCAADRQVLTQFEPQVLPPSRLIPQHTCPPVQFAWRLQRPPAHSGGGSVATKPYHGDASALLWQQN
jgi:hypothetical protein